MWSYDAQDLVYCLYLYMCVCVCFVSPISPHAFPYMAKLSSTYALIPKLCPNLSPNTNPLHTQGCQMLLQVICKTVSEGLRKGVEGYNKIDKIACQQVSNGWCSSGKRMWNTIFDSVCLWSIIWQPLTPFWHPSTESITSLHKRFGISFRNNNYIKTYIDIHTYMYWYG